jgi:hypothetical protein
MAGNRYWFKDGGTNGRDRSRIYFTFNTNNGAAINTSLIIGGSDVVSTINNANTGEFIITLSARDFYTKVVYANATLEDTSTGGQKLATIGNFTNEAATNSAPLVFKVFTYDSTMALANIANTRVFVEVVVMDRAPVRSGDP